MTFTCFLFHHAPSPTTIRADVMNERFVCRRCGESIRWIDMPRLVIGEVVRARTRLAELEGQ
jgi:hypothetical protein